MIWIFIDPTNEIPLIDIGVIREKLKDLLGVTLDVLTPNAKAFKIQPISNDIDRKDILRKFIRYDVPRRNDLK